MDLAAGDAAEGAGDELTTVRTDADEPITLLGLPPELLVLIVSRIPAPSAWQLALVSHAAQALALNDEVWLGFLERIWPDALPEDPQMAAFLRSVLPETPPDDSPKSAWQRFVHHSYQKKQPLGYRQGCPAPQPTVGLACPWGRCGGSLLFKERRCICVPTRERLPLRIASLGLNLAGSSSFDDGGFSTMLSSLRACYHVEDVGGAHGITIDGLEADTLAPLDVLVLCTTEGPALTPTQLSALRSWVEAGGALIVSAFSNWSRHDHFAVDTVGWLGLVPVPRARFGGPTASAFEPHARGGAPQPYTHGQSAAGELCVASDDETTALLDFACFDGCGRGPEAACFINRGETRVQVLDAAFDAGAVQLVVNEGARGQGGESTPLLPRRLANLVFYPPRPTAMGGVTGRGRVLVCSNYHWLANPSHWMGGLVTQGANMRLLHNFVAGAVAARAER